MKTTIAAAVICAASLVAAGANAQDVQAGQTGQAGASGTASGSVQTSTPPVVTSTAQTTAPVAPPAQLGAASTTAGKPDDTTPDHDRFIRRLAVGYLGLNDLPIANAPGNAGNPGTISASRVAAPTIGVRYWITQLLGIDAGLGIGYSGGSVDVALANGTSTSTDKPSAFALAVHGGVPLAFAYGKHYKFLLVPELNVGYARRGEKQNGNPAPPDIVRTGLRVDAGARIGTEIQFGFIGIPELALQASVGLNVRYQNWKSQQDAGPPVVPTERSSSDTQTSIGTTVQADPWALFVNNISAIYYFP